MKAKWYVVTKPDSARGIYETWAECKALVNRVRGARYQSVESREKAEAMLGDGIVLPAGTYAFTDGNAQGGVGVVIVDGGGSAPPKEHAVSVAQVFAGQGIAGLETDDDVEAALEGLHNILAELAGLFLALRLVPPPTELTIVHDYKGIAAWMEGRWKTRNPIVTSVVTACRQLVQDRGLVVTYQHQRGHQSSWAGRDDFAYWNDRADKLATRAGGSTIFD